MDISISVSIKVNHLEVGISIFECKKKQCPSPHLVQHYNTAIVEGDCRSIGGNPAVTLYSSSTKI